MTTSLAIATDGLLGTCGATQYITTSRATVSVANDSLGVFLPSQLTAKLQSDRVTVGIAKSELAADLDGNITVTVD